MGGEDVAAPALRNGSPPRRFSGRLARFRRNETPAGPAGKENACPAAPWAGRSIARQLLHHDRGCARGMWPTGNRTDSESRAQGFLLNAIR